MGFNKEQLKSLVESTLKYISVGKYKFYSDDVVWFLLRIFAQESKFGYYLEQLGNGPAKGLGQVEPFTQKDNYINWLQYRPEIVEKIAELCGTAEPLPLQLYNPIRCIIEARIKLYRSPGAIPPKADILGQAKYWKKYYNSEQGQGKINEFIDNAKDFNLT